MKKCLFARSLIGFVTGALVVHVITLLINYFRPRPIPYLYAQAYRKIWTCRSHRCSDHTCRDIRHGSPRRDVSFRHRKMEPAACLGGALRTYTFHVHNRRAAAALVFFRHNTHINHGVHNHLCLCADMAYHVHRLEKRNPANEPPCRRI